MPLGKVRTDDPFYTEASLVPRTRGLTLGTEANPFANIYGNNIISDAAGAGAIAGSVTINGTTPVAVASTNFKAGSVVIFSLKTVGGTVGQLPHIVTATPGTGFTVAGTALDTSIYNWAILETA